jgi:hypothetical protein
MPCPSLRERGLSVGRGAILPIFFVTLGPIKLLGPFVQQTSEVTPAALLSPA